MVLLIGKMSASHRRSIGCRFCKDVSLKTLKYFKCVFRLPFIYAAVMRSKRLATQTAIRSFKRNRFGKHFASQIFGR